ncbi:MAG: hypothetical protein IPK31_17355 [Chitinophagaceae bacterium]|nr:hypothetical protein [Chitinophagaceae bacterium]
MFAKDAESQHFNIFCMLAGHHHEQEFKILRMLDKWDTIQADNNKAIPAFLLLAPKTSSQKQ